MVFKTADNRELFAHQWHVEFPRGVIVLVHGQGEHAGRYGSICRFFNENKLAVVSFDQQGHGKTAGIRGDMISVESLLDDVGLCLDEARQRYPGTPVFIYGHSLGGQEVLSFLIKRRPAGITGAVVTSPWIDLAKPANFIKIWLGKLLILIAPKLTLSNDLYFPGISRDPGEVEKYKKDPLVHGMISARAGIDLWKNARLLQNFSGAMPVPTLLMHGSGDLLTSFPASGAFSKRVGNIDWLPWPGFYHELHNEPEKHEVWQAILDWANDKLD